MTMACLASLFPLPLLHFSPHSMLHQTQAPGQPVTHWMSQRVISAVLEHASWTTHMTPSSLLPGPSLGCIAHQLSGLSLPTSISRCAFTATFHMAGGHGPGVAAGRRTAGFRAVALALAARHAPFILLVPRLTAGRLHMTLLPDAAPYLGRRGQPYSRDPSVTPAAQANSPSGL